MLFELLIPLWGKTFETTHDGLWFRRPFSGGKRYLVTSKDKAAQLKKLYGALMFMIIADVGIILVMTQVLTKVPDFAAIPFASVIFPAFVLFGLVNFWWILRRQETKLLDGITPKDDKTIG